MKKNADFGLLMARLVAGGIMLNYGFTKYLIGDLGDGHILKWLESSWLPDFLIYGVPVGEVVAPIMILLGLYGRVGAFLQAFTMIISIYHLHNVGLDIFSITSKYGHWAIETNASLLMLSIGILISGSGIYSVRKGRHLLD